MAFKREDLLKFSKSTELAIQIIEDDSSPDTDLREGTEVKILHLLQEVTAVGSNPTPEGNEMRAKGRKVYVAGPNIDEMLKNLTEKDGVLIYKGPMHLDVSKPNGRYVNGKLVVTKPAKIWLTAIKFSRGGAMLRQQQSESVSDMINKIFPASGILDLTVTETASASGTTQPEPPKKEGTAPEVVANKGNSKVTV